MRLTSNRTFSHLAWHYGLLDTLIMRPNQLGPRSTAEEEQRTAANAFEAHVDGLIEAHHGDTRPVYDYLRELLQPSVFPAFVHIQQALKAASSSDNPAPANRRPRLDTGDPVLGEIRTWSLLTVPGSPSYELSDCLNRCGEPDRQWSTCCDPISLPRVDRRVRRGAALDGDPQDRRPSGRGWLGGQDRGSASRSPGRVSARSLERHCSRLII